MVSKRPVARHNTAYLAFSGLCCALYAAFYLYPGTIILYPLWIALPAFSPIIQGCAFWVCLERGSRNQAIISVLFNVLSTAFGLMIAFHLMGPEYLFFTAISLGSLQFLSTLMILISAIVERKRFSRPSQVLKA